jgi:hypothetical protein
MDTVSAVNPVAGVAVTDYARPAVVAPPSAAPPDLPSSKAVNPLAEVTPTNKEIQQQSAAATFISRGFVIDPQSREVIYRVMDTRTRQVIWQVPDAALLRSRAYAQTLKDASQPAAHLTNVTE